MAARSRRAPERVFAVFAGGGTGGHLYPGLAVARELVERGHDPTSLCFVGAARGLEARTNALQGYPSTLLPGRGLSRGRSARDLLSNARALAGTAAAAATALRLFAKWRPAVVVPLGGYAAVPCVVAAIVWRSPMVVVNVDAVPGTANRLASRLAAASAVGTADVAVPRAVHTGVPVRRSMEEVDRSEQGRLQARQRLGLEPGAMVVAVSGGSLGSLRINEATAALAKLWAGRDGLAIYHVVGSRDWERFKASGRNGPGLVYRVVRYEDDMALLYSAADLAVQRAGANTVAELALAGLASVLVPLPGSPGDHQGANARAMAGAGGAVVVSDAELDGERLAEVLGPLVGDRAKLAQMGAAARALGRPGAAAAVADLVELHARARRGDAGKASDDGR